MNYTSELIDAIKTQYADDPQLQVSILQELMQNNLNTKYIKNVFEGVCAENRICPVCLSEMKLVEYKEDRPYQEGVAYETMNTLICPNCGMEV